MLKNKILTGNKMSVASSNVNRNHDDAKFALTLGYNEDDEQQ
jgi:hypothetical protein